MLGKGVVGGDGAEQFTLIITNMHTSVNAGQKAKKTESQKDRNRKRSTNNRETIGLKKKLYFGSTLINCWEKKKKNRFDKGEEQGLQGM